MTITNTFASGFYFVVIDHNEYIARYGDDMPEITGWRWGQEAAASPKVRSTEADNV
jgi:xylulose-5-phosphate/fructose-6-phosphate phosphoketolase